MHCKMYFFDVFQVDVIHMYAEPGNQTVAYGMDLSEYYLNVEWDILRVPAERHVKKYPCCPEPYPGKTQNNSRILYRVWPLNSVRRYL